MPCYFDEKQYKSERSHEDLTERDSYQEKYMRLLNSHNELIAENFNLRNKEEHEVIKIKVETKFLCLACKFLSYNELSSINVMDEDRNEENNLLHWFLNHIQEDNEELKAQGERK